MQDHVFYLNHLQYLQHHGVWKRIEGSKTVEVCFICRLLAKSLRFLGSPFVNISLHFKLMVDAFSLHQPFSTSC